MRLWYWMILVVSVVALFPVAPTQAFVASGISRSPAALLTVAGVTDLAFTPDEQLLLLTQKDGQLRIADVGTDGTLALRSTAALDLSAHTCTESERGLLGVVADPAIATNGFVYLFYTYDRGVTGQNRCARVQPITANSPVNRVSRFTLAPNGTINPASERVLVDNMPSPAGNHNAGGLNFGKDGYLYIAIGDGGCDYAGGGCAGTNDAARDANVLTGKILRIIPNPNLAPEQRIPSSNPFSSSGTICALNGRGPNGTPITTPCRETFAYGLRNPFRMAFDPNTIAPETRFLINDVGQNMWEEVNIGEAGADYRWNQCEGFHVTGATASCPTPTGAQRNPLHEYGHSDSCSSITAGAIIPNAVWPAGFAGTYLYADAVCGRIYQINPAAPANRTLFADGMNYIASMVFGPGPNGIRALYTAQVYSGEIYRFMPQQGNRAPTARLSANPQFGSLSHSFDATGSNDPENEPLTYLWDFGNGVNRETTTASTSYTYPTNGRYTASLQVRDSQGALSSTATLLIDTSNQPPVVTITSPTPTTRFAVGQTITLRATATDDTDGTLPASAYVWNVYLHHRASAPDAHFHPFVDNVTGPETTFTAPSPEDLDAASNSYLEIVLLVTDSGGAYRVVRQDLLPISVPVTIHTIPTGLKLLVQGTIVDDGTTLTSWQGYPLTVQVYPQADSSGWLHLARWNDGTASNPRTFITAATDYTITATFEPPAGLSFLSVVSK